MASHADKTSRNPCLDITSPPISLKEWAETRISDMIMQEQYLKKRVRGWVMFDWATQPFYTLGLTFIFGPYFASVAAEYFLNSGLDLASANARAQT